LSSNGNETACFEAVSLETDEVIYGLGERFDSLTRNGRTVDFHNKDAVGTTSRRTYINIPFYLSTKGYGLFLNSSAKTDWQIATTDLNAVQFGVLEGQLDYFVIAGETPKDIIKGYCHLTGFSKLPPLWSFGLWMSRNSYTSWEVVDEIAKEVRENDIPCDVLHLDTAWFTEDWNCDLKFSEERFPNPKEHIKMLNDKGFKVSLWQYNFIPPRDNNSNYHEAVEHGYLAKDSQGKPYQLPESKKGSWTDDVIIDFSNPEARKWYSEKIKGLMDIGASAIKTDFGEGIPEDAVYHSIDGKHFHNLYSLVYNSTVFNASNENIVWARSGTAGSQRYPLHWGGDSQCSFAALAGTLRAALSLGLSGIPFFSHDIGGFIGTPDDELYIRWAQLGLFSSHSRCHGVGDNAHREPWYFSNEALEIFRFYDKLRYSLMPYIYSQAKKCTETGLPMMRALYLEYPEDRNTRFIDDEYLFGESLLIAPVLKPLSKGRTRDIYLPKGIWHDYFTKEKIVSDGKWITRAIDLKTMPIYVKDGTVLEYCSADTCLADGMGETVKTEKWQ
jgi:alpha-D-xyloside xylohydrolase